MNELDLKVDDLFFYYHVLWQWWCPREWHSNGENDNTIIPRLPQ